MRTAQLAASLPDLCTIIAPRHPERGGGDRRDARGSRLQAWRGARSAPCRTATSDAYIADTIGELGMLYKLAPVAFIGGSLVDRGGQNPIEAVRQGAAVLTGPHWQNFADTYERADQATAAPSSCARAEEIASAAGRLLADEAELGGMRTRANAALATISGALPRTVEALLRYLPAEEGLARAS